MNIDASGCETSVQYSIVIDDSALEDYPNIHFKIIDLDTNVEMNESSTSGIMYLNDTNKTKNLKLVLEWDNEAEYDESDTSLIDQTLQFNVNANFKQYLGD